MYDADVVDNSSTQGSNSEQEGRNGSHNESFIARDTHVPEREVPNQQAQASQNRPEGEAEVDISQGVKHVTLGVSGSKNLTNGLVLFGLSQLVGDSLVVAAHRSG